MAAKLVVMALVSEGDMFVGPLGAAEVGATMGLPGNRMVKGLGAMALGRDCGRVCGEGTTAGCCERGVFRSKEEDKFVEARVCWTDRIVWASADSAAACESKREGNNNKSTCLG